MLRNGNTGLAWLQILLSDLCDEEWEHCHGFKIESTSNPGWALQFDFNETAYDNIHIETVKIDSETEDKWIIYSFKEGVFVGGCAPKMLEETLIRLSNILSQCGK